MDQDALTRIADALERVAPPPNKSVDIHSADAFIWHNQHLLPIKEVAHIKLNLLRGIDHVRDILLQNTEQFAKGYAANNALLWGARGMGKSSLIKAIHENVNAHFETKLALIEIHREDINTMPELLQLLSNLDRRILLFCDDLSFDHDDTCYKSLKTILDGGIVGRPDHILLYATSNRRHLMPREMIENEQSTAIHPSEAIEEKISLSDRFGLWLGFHSCDQATFLAIIEGYIESFGLDISKQQWHAEAIEWSQTRGARSGRVAWQYIQDLAGRLEKTLS